MTRRAGWVEGKVFHASMPSRRNMLASGDMNAKMRAEAVGPQHGNLPYD